MKNKKLVSCLLAALCISALSGCSKNNTKNEQTTFQEVPITENGESSNKGKDSSGGKSKDTSDSSDAEVLLSNADIGGHVVEFSDTGCIISPTKTAEADGGTLGIEVAPGFEKEEDNVNVHYSESCQFQLAKISIKTSKVDLSDIDISDIKKQTSLLIYGEKKDEHNIEAKKVIITRYE